MGAEILLLLDVAIILGAAHLFGEIAERIKIHPMVGQIFAGIIVGPVLHFVAPNEFLSQLSNIGVILLLFLIGLSTRFSEMKEHVWNGSIIAIVACATSLVGGLVTGILLFNSIQIGAFLGVALMGTSTAIPVKMLMDMGSFRTRVGQMIIAISMADDVITILGLSLLASWFALGTVQIWQAASLAFAMVGFILAVITVGARVSDKLLFIVQRMKDEQVLLAIPIVVVFCLAFFADKLGIAAVTGAFLAGMAMAGSVFTEPVIAPKVRTIGYGFFIPIFFAYSALVIDLGVLAAEWWVIAIILAVAILTKVVSSGLAAGWFNFKRFEKGVIAIGMIPRGEYGIVISQIALAFGVIGAELYGAMIAVVVITVIITPILLRLYLHGRKI